MESYIKWNADFINNKIKEVISSKGNKKVITKSTSVEKVIALINIELKERLDGLKQEDRQELSFLEEKGITVIVELDYPLTTKSEQHLKKIYNEEGFFFQYCPNEHKEKYFVCVGTK